MAAELNETVNSESLPVLRADTTSCSTPAPSLTTAATAGPSVLALMASAICCLVAPAARLIVAVGLPGAAYWSVIVSAPVVLPWASKAAGVKLKRRWAEEARRSTEIDWPPMPAPESIVTATRAGSELSTVCFWAHVASALSASAASLNAASLDATSLRASCWPLTAALR